MKINHVAVAAGLALIAGLTSAASAQTRTIYSNTFESRELGYNWSSNTKLVTWNPTFTTFNGNYSSGWTELNIRAAERPVNRNGSTGSGGTGGSGGGTGGSGGGGGGGGGGVIFRNLYTLTFDLYIIDSWDAGEARYGTDRLMVSVNGSGVFNNTFTNHAGIVQSFRAPDIGGRNLGFMDYNDAIYRRVSVQFEDPGTHDIQIRWADGGLQGINDESWGIDNVNVSYEVVPAPTGAAALLGGLGLLGSRRRRR